MLTSMTGPSVPGESSEEMVSSLEILLDLTKAAQGLSRIGLNLTGMDLKKKKTKKTFQSWRGENVQKMLGGCRGPLVESEPEGGVKRGKLAMCDLTML